MGNLEIIESVPFIKKNIEEEKSNGTAPVKVTPEDISTVVQPSLLNKIKESIQAKLNHEIPADILALLTEGIKNQTITQDNLESVTQEVTKKVAQTSGLKLETMDASAAEQSKAQDTTKTKQTNNPERPSSPTKKEISDYDDGPEL